MENSKRRTTGITAFITLVLIVFLSSCSRQKKLPEWMLGNWMVEFTDYSVKESWSENDDKFQGTTLWTGKLKSWQEDLVLYINDNDDLVYRTTIDGRTKDFVCKNPDADTLLFVNHTNEFPKRLHYSKPKANKMEVWIDNVDNDPNRIDFHFQKIK